MIRVSALKPLILEFSRSFSFGQNDLHCCGRRVSWCLCVCPRSAPLARSTYTNLHILVLRHVSSLLIELRILGYQLGDAENMIKPLNKAQHVLLVATVLMSHRSGMHSSIPALRSVRHVRLNPALPQLSVNKENSETQGS